jgi:heterodisulfide reductase subunit A-like polyferredoxin
MIPSPPKIQGQVRLCADLLVASAGTPPPTDGPVTHDFDADVVVIGSGSTGVSTALYLAQEHGIKAVILEANQTAW